MRLVAQKKLAKPNSGFGRYRTVSHRGGFAVVTASTPSRDTETKVFSRWWLPTRSDTSIPVVEGLAADVAAILPPAAKGFVAFLQEWPGGEGWALLGDEDAGREAARLVLRQHIQEEASGPLASVPEVMEIIGVTSRNAVHERAKKGQLLAVRGPGRKVRFPRSQFTPTGDVWPGIPEVVAVLESSEMDGWQLAAWLTGRGSQPELEGMSPVEWLKAGRDPAWVVTAAHQTARERSQ